MLVDDVVHNTHIRSMVTQQAALLRILGTSAIPSGAARPISSIVATAVTAKPLAEVEARLGANRLPCTALTADPKCHETLVNDCARDLLTIPVATPMETGRHDTGYA